MKVIVLHVKESMKPELTCQNIIEDDVEFSGKLTASINTLPKVFPNEWLYYFLRRGGGRGRWSKAFLIKI